ncbi:MAG: hypothetical protein IJ713_01195 [Oscillibacter sp.]|nr:hypothetical protein [Oscillibacter sp.]
MVKGKHEKSRPGKRTAQVPKEIGRDFLVGIASGIAAAAILKLLGW